jgi:hypothetical protein
MYVVEHIYIIRTDFKFRLEAAVRFWSVHRRTKLGVIIGKCNGGG